MISLRTAGGGLLALVSIALGACSAPSSADFEYVHFPDYDPSINMPYTPAIAVNSGKIVFFSGVTAAPVYHSHPHILSEFDGIPDDAATQAEMTMENLRRAVEAAGGELTDVIQLNRFIVNIAENQDAINAVAGRMMGDHRPASTTVEVTRLATDPRLVLEIEAVAVVPN